MRIRDEETKAQEFKSTRLVLVPMDVIFFIYAVQMLVDV